MSHKRFPYPKSTLMLQVALPTLIMSYRDKGNHFNFHSDNVMNQRYHMINIMMAIAFGLVNLKNLYTGNTTDIAHALKGG